MTLATRTLGNEAWPDLRVPGWHPACETLQLWSQIVGKTRLALAPMQNHWWQVTLYVTARGVTTSAIPYRGTCFEVEFDLIDHRLVVRTPWADDRSFPLTREPVAEFYGRYRALLRDLGIDVHIRPVPCELAVCIPFAEDHGHAGYDPEVARRLHGALVRVHDVFLRFRSGFLGKCSPSHLWWGAFDLAYTRFSGRIAPVHPGGIPNLPDRVTREAYSHECMSVGWWPGNDGGPVDEPSFYAYGYAEPPGFSAAHVGPAAAHYHETLREWVLPYAAVRSASDPDRALLEFLDTAYTAVADLGGWDRAALERPRG